MTPDIEKIEHLLNAKTFDALTAAERELVLAHLSGAAEYEHMRETLLRVKKVFTAEASAQAADADLKEYILTRFDQNRPQPHSLAARISAWVQKLFPTPAGRFAGALAMLLLVVTVGFFAWPTERKDVAQQLLPRATEVQTITVSDDAPAVPPSEMIQYGAGTVVTEGNAQTMIMDMDGDAIPPPEVPLKDYTPPVLSSAADEKAEERTARESLREESAAPVYRNNEGYYQYRNTRTAQAETRQKNTEASDKLSYKKTPAKPKGIDNADQASQTEIKQSLFEKEDISGGAVKSEYDRADPGALTVAAKETTVRSVPVWPGTEKRENAAALTLKNLNAFFAVSNYAAADSVRPVQEVARSKAETATAKLTLRFNAEGVITKVHVSGTDEARKKALIRRALQLPAFKFTDGNGQILEQTYRISIPR